MSKRPCFVFAMTEHATSLLQGASGCETPHLDALAANGVWFENFFTAWPAHAEPGSFMTSRYPGHGLGYNGCVPPASANTFVDVPAADGFKTAAIDKSHLQLFSDNPLIGEMSKKSVSDEVYSTAYTRDRSFAYEQPAGRDEQFFLFIFSRIRITPSSAGQVLGYVKTGGFRTGSTL